MRLALALLLIASGCNSILGIGQPGGAKEDAAVADAAIEDAPIDAPFDGPPAEIIHIGGLSSVGPVGAVAPNTLQVVDAKFEAGQTVCNGTVCLTGGLTP